MLVRQQHAKGSLMSGCKCCLTSLLILANTEHSEEHSKWVMDETPMHHHIKTHDIKTHDIE